MRYEESTDFAPMCEVIHTQSTPLANRITVVRLAYYIVREDNDESLLLISMLISASLVLEFSKSACAEQNFGCGTEIGHAVLYTVRAVDHTAGSGVRCIKLQVLTTGSKILIWYGEGQWQNRTYRHVGQASPGCADQPYDFCGDAADIHGNGEYFNNVANAVQFKAVSGSWPTPNQIRVSGPWNEVWDRAPTDTTNYNPLPRPATCGDNLNEYTVSDLANQRKGTGIRCVLRRGNPPYTSAWFGNGDWDRATYSHLGTFSIALNTNGTIGGGTGGATDLCDPAFGQICSGDFRVGLLRFMSICATIDPGPPPIRAFEGFTVQGAWSEEWDRPGGPCFIGN